MLKGRGLRQPLPRASGMNLFAELYCALLVTWRDIKTLRGRKWLAMSVFFALSHVLIIVVKGS
jgi:hypothetical protein